MDHKDIFNQWLNNPQLDDEQVKRLVTMSEDEIKEAFYAPLAFGTAGMRGILDMGINRMNVFTVARATKGLADFVNSLGEGMRGVVISYDTRRCSSEFAAVAAKVLAAQNVNAYLFENVRPVPMCSFAIRRLNAIAGIMITASHNPKEYNGYKVYGEDGAQMSPESTDKVVKYIDKTPYFGIPEVTVDLSADKIKGLDDAHIHPHITVIGKSVDDAYFAEIEKLSLSPNAVKQRGKSIRIVYTPVHGSGYMPVTSILKKMGITVNVVPEQSLPDPDFSTVRVPNPEEADTLKMGVALANKIGSDIVIGTDPDADRMGIAVRNDKNEFVLLNGNQIGILLENYVLLRSKQNGVLPKNGAVVKTIVTTELARKIADSYGVTTFDVLTGFKFIGEKIKEWEENGKYTYMFGFEESYGSLVGTHARDKDAVVASMMFAEMVCYFECEGKKIYDVLQDIYARYGYFKEKAKSVSFGGIDGMMRMKNIMKELRATDFTEVCGRAVVACSDFLDGITTFACGKFEKTDLPKTDAIKLFLDGGDWICVRPSGTEPKLKIYASASRQSEIEADAAATAYLDKMSEILQ